MMVKILFVEISDDLRKRVRMRMAQDDVKSIKDFTIQALEEKLERV